MLHTCTRKWPLLAHQQTDIARSSQFNVGKYKRHVVCRLRNDKNSFIVVKHQTNETKIIITERLQPGIKREHHGFYY